MSFPHHGLLASVILTCAAAAAGDELTVYWGRKKFPAAELSDAVPAGARTAIELWSSWAIGQGYRMDLTKDGRVLLMCIDDNNGRKSAKKNMRLIEKTLPVIDEILPMPQGRKAAPKTAEDDTTYERGHFPRESQTAALVEIDDLIHYTAVVNHLISTHRYLGRWGSTTLRATGFAIDTPLAGAWTPMTDIKGDYEAKPANKLISRLTQTMMLRRFGQQPHWLRMGIAWYVEMETTKGIYCFPFRTGTVRASAHTGWDKNIEARLGRRKEPLAIEDVAALEHGEWSTEDAEVAWATVTFLVRFHPDALPQILDELYTMWDEQSRDYNDDDDDEAWERIANFEPPLEDQLAAIEKYIPEFLPELLRYFHKGKHYKP